jgi:hypothetical protein
MKRINWPAFLVWFCFVLGVISGISSLSARQESGGDERLKKIFVRIKDYCLKLERAALDFTCMEKIEEKMYSLPEIQPDTTIFAPSQQVVIYSYQSPKRPYSHTYVYDYQFVHKGDQKTEKRTLIEENGRKKNEKDAQLATLRVRVENALFGPIGLLGAQWQAYHDYKIIGEETQKGKKIVVIEAVPKPSLNRPHCFGRIWIREDDASIVKIAWDQTSVGNFMMIQATAQELKADPRLTSVTEYTLEKNGIRFPSKDTTEEAYLLKNGKKFIRSLTTILYRDYKFFTVELEVNY